MITLLETSTPLSYYRYKSVVADVFFNMSYSKVGVKDEFIGKNKEDMNLHEWFQDFFNERMIKNKYYFDTNKIVFKMKTNMGGIFYLGWRDGNISLGLSVTGDKFIKQKRCK